MKRFLVVFLTVCLFLGASVAADADSRSFRANLAKTYGNAVYKEGVSIAEGKIMYSRTLKKGKTHWYALTFPSGSAGLYRFYSTGGLDLVGSLHRKRNGAMITMDDDTGEGVNFSITYQVSSGRKLFLKVRGANKRVKGPYSVYIEKLGSPTPTPTLRPTPTPTPTPTSMPTPTPTPKPTPTPVAATYRAMTVGTGRSNEGDKVIFALDAKNFGDMLVRLSFGGKRITAIRNLDNPTTEQARAGIREFFSGATEDDVSFLYLMCHGAKPQNGSYQIALGTDTNITTRQLRQWLDAIPGKINLILCSCYSGDAIGKGAENFAQGFVEEFTRERAVGKSGEFVDDKYNVICASAGNQVGVVIYYIDQSAAWCLSGSTVARGAGWMYQDTREPYYIPFQADYDGDGRITMKEIYDYAEPIIKELYVKYNLNSETGVIQLCSYPYDDSVIFARD